MGKRVEERLDEILAELAGIGPVLPGSITGRTTRCQSPGCHCRSEPAVLHGPYPTWTWRPHGRAMTKTLTQEQAALLAPYSRAHRRLRQLVNELERISLQLIEHNEGLDFDRAHELGKPEPESGN